MSVYRKVYRIGAGGMGAVYRATRTLPGDTSNAPMPVACKIVRPDRLARERFVSMFKREARLTIGMRHANVIEVYDLLADDLGLLYLIMELIEGVSVHELDAAGSTGEAAERLSFDMLRVIAADILDALDYIHGRQVMHRDISPDNVMVDRTGRVKLSDFGVAKAITSDAVQSAGLVGKLAYQAPEVKEDAPLDVRADLYSLAAMLYELLTGKLPFGSQHMDIVMKQHVWSLEPLPRNVPDDLRALVMGLLIKDPDERSPQTAREARGRIRMPNDEVYIRAQLGAMADAGYRAKCARAEERERRRAIQGESADDVIHARPLVDWRADTPPDSRSADPDRTQSAASDSDATTQPDGSEANGDRWIVHRPRLAVACVLAAVAIALVVAWSAGSGNQDGASVRAVPSAVDNRDPANPDDGADQATRIDGVAHLAPQPPPTVTDSPPSPTLPTETPETTEESPPAPGPPVAEVTREPTTSPTNRAAGKRRRGTRKRRITRGRFTIEQFTDYDEQQP